MSPGDSRSATAKATPARNSTPSRCSSGGSPPTTWRSPFSSPTSPRCDARFHSSLGDLATGPTLARIRRVLDPLSKGWPVWSSQIAERLLVPELNQQLAPPPGTERDVRLVFASRDLAALPWELCRAWDSQAPLSQGPGVKMLYRCLDERLRKEAKTRAAQAVLTELGYYLNIADGLTGPARSMRCEGSRPTRG